MSESAMSWGRWPRHRQSIVPVFSRFDPLPGEGLLLAYGSGRSYGDVCLNDGGTLLSTRGLDRWISFDENTGVLECEAGVLLRDIMDRFVRLGWFPAVSPGTGFVTVGGAVANDVHGKNHHRAGTFGHHVLSLELLRSEEGVLTCSPNMRNELFRSTIGGLGLTGLIRTVRLQLRPVPGPWMRGDCVRFSSLEEFFQLATDSDRNFEYTVAWLDCVAPWPKLGRGVLMRANHEESRPTENRVARARKNPVSVWITPPFCPVRAKAVQMLNGLYYHRAGASRWQRTWHYRDFLHPLDGILNWNRLYGTRGFFQYQCVVPFVDAQLSLVEMLAAISRSGQGSFLSVLKAFGSMAGAGLMSFPRAGVTLALDFPNRGESTLRLLESLDAITRDARGAVYPAKDARMSSASFQRYFPEWKQFRGHIDRRFSSSFWRRVTRDRS